MYKYYLKSYNKLIQSVLFSKKIVLSHVIKFEMNLPMHKYVTSDKYRLDVQICQFQNYTIIVFKFAIIHGRAHLSKKSIILSGVIKFEINLPMHK